MNKELITHDLKGIRLFFDEPLSTYTYTRTGGPADVLVFPESQEQVRQVVDYCLSNHYPWLVLGNASNLIVKDGGIEGFVIILTDMKQVELTGNQLTVDAGASLIETTKLALEASLTGFEFACGIPGSIGGAVYMNAGAYGGEIKDIFTSCTVIWEDGTLEELTLDEMQFSYRHSILQEKKGVILSATFTLKKGKYDQIFAKMDELTFLRESKQPLELPSCGSVFKRPEGHFTGALIQEANLQGYTIGGAQISMKHAGFIVNIGGATATDYMKLIAYIQEVIFEKNQVRLEPEVRIIGRD
ncbi:UDP-N-acetylmuramate dehydrogenase [Vagococcus xieshaowenii]|uniref:UDP-N-acetylenolpyruvoylglucosamine reductase n=1 Tax=Vagococcus xieshaowenii TaxID=2562451 RepID=A0AAJ5EEC8_9ENTE|nr:UDP-N-acetylmuramate dehydrogenase [Vagococcus xieshaowenii]QCA29343.1 UDP-N-acetylmuramate dehydrogenase [Vagococcus xieshaowenii]TFZ39365.1 UDP-N-acetylmuramate dehydrogenase [Vagococcus xieshaowenii]